MELFNKVEAVRLRSHLDKFLLAEEDEETVRQSRNGSSRKVQWTVELVEGNSHVVRLKSCYGRYLTASNVPFLLGMTGKKVLQTAPGTNLDSLIEWEPIRDGFQVKLRTRAGKFLRANGGTPPWRNSITHDVPKRTATHDWVLWSVDMVDISQAESFSGYESQLSSLSSLSDEYLDSLTSSPLSGAASLTKSSRYSMSSSALTKSPVYSFSSQKGMEIFHNAKAVRLRSHHEKYLLAEEDEESVCQDRNGSSKRAKWTVEFVDGMDTNFIRLKSCYGKYLTASNAPFLLGMTGRKVLQTLPRRLDSSLEWEPIREGVQVKLKTRYGNFLRANGGIPPWRNSITHDVPNRTATQDWVLWDVDIVEILVKSPSQPPPPPPPPQPTSSSPPSTKTHKLSKLESSDSLISSPPKVDGRTIYFYVADDNGKIDESIEAPSFIFKGTKVDELTRKLEEETELEDIIVCTRNPVRGNLYPLRLQLPPNKTTMQVVVVTASSQMARDFETSGLL